MPKQDADYSGNPHPSASGAQCGTTWQEGAKARKILGAVRNQEWKLIAGAWRKMPLYCTVTEIAVISLENCSDTPPVLAKFQYAPMLPSMLFATPSLHMLASVQKPGGSYTARCRCKTARGF
jgi:hypothetical protein